MRSWMRRHRWILAASLLLALAIVVFVTRGIEEAVVFAVVALLIASSLARRWISTDIGEHRPASRRPDGVPAERPQVLRPSQATQLTVARVGAVCPRTPGYRADAPARTP
jgi:hypothetical protein